MQYTAIYQAIAHSLAVEPVAGKQGGLMGFSPKSLFSSGAQGAWYDPSDYTTLFEDAAGTIPITSPLEKPVGLLLDKSKGLVLGPELVTNGDFSNGKTDWSSGSGNTTLTVVDGEARCEITNNVGSTQSMLYRSVAIATSNVLYKVEFDVYSPTFSGSVRFSLNDSSSSDGFSFTAPVTTTKTRITAYLRAGTTPKLWITATTALAIGTVLYFDNISVKELPGNHATQSTTTSRPTLSARYNLLTKTEQFDDAGWVVASSGGGVNGVKTPNYGIAPDGTQTACRIQLDVSAGAVNAQSQVYKNYAIQNDTTLTKSIWAKTTSGTGTVTLMGLSAGGALPKLTVTGTWTLFNISQTAVATLDNFQIVLVKGSTSDVADILVWHPDARVANDGVGLPAYQRVDTATSYDYAGFPLAEVLDGTDDNQITAAGGGSTTAFFWCSSIRVGKVGAVQTLFSDTGTNTGYRVRINASNQLELAAGNNTTYITATTTDTLTFGQRAVLTAWHDGANLNVQINNGTVVQAAFATATAGTAQITIGKDNNAASSYFMGRLYEKVYLKDTVVSASNITATKNYCANKAKITL